MNITIFQLRSKKAPLGSSKIRTQSPRDRRGLKKPENAVLPAEEDGASGHRDPRPWEENRQHLCWFADGCSAAAAAAAVASYCR